VYWVQDCNIVNIPLLTADEYIECKNFLDSLWDMYWGNIGNAAKTKPEAHYEKTLIHGHQESVMELVSS
jgi:hypothetical protein